MKYLASSNPSAQPVGALPNSEARADEPHSVMQSVQTTTLLVKHGIPSVSRQIVENISAIAVLPLPITLVPATHTPRHTSISHF